MKKKILIIALNTILLAGCTPNYSRASKAMGARNNCVSNSDCNKEECGCGDGCGCSQKCPCKRR